jgi:hypothetical protein
VPDPIFKQLVIIEKKFGDFPLSALSDPRTRGIFKEWRDELAIKVGLSPRCPVDPRPALFASRPGACSERDQEAVHR